ncbi:hypothetical protein LJC22_04710 [Desulfosarcina sp. OttesenSCG-928-G10]|nr:hypothetical protein [Desulfosarcina sp. OttesenSCG-928-G10]MDL2322301.1 hypothetical protein [Desulfosarcina sp. OttesenSCG-928-B08]
MKTQLDMYREWQDDLAKKYNGKIIVVKDGDVPTEPFGIQALVLLKTSCRR